MRAASPVRPARADTDPRPPAEARGRRRNIRDVATAVRSWPLSLGHRGMLPNGYDLALFLVIGAAFVAVAHVGHEMDAPLARLDLAPVTLDLAKLPEYALRTTLR